MNFLAHAWLSFDDSETLAGNMTSDFIKGKKKLEYPKGIQRGIELHRQIDHFTDTHSITARAKSLFRKDYGLYSGAFVDVAYDYFLANDPSIFPVEQDLALFAQRVYLQLEQQAILLPEKFRRLFYYMKRQDWLLNYRSKQGIFHSFEGLVRRAVYMDNAFQAIQVFNENLPELNDCYRIFFPELRMFARNSWNDSRF
jgi:acyl carrier protein phosphodiesterase